MKKGIVLLLTAALLLTGCGGTSAPTEIQEKKESTQEANTADEAAEIVEQDASVEEHEDVEVEETEAQQGESRRGQNNQNSQENFGTGFIRVYNNDGTNGPRYISIN